MDQPDEWDEAGYRAVQARAEGSNLDPVTLLATDYLNHFNEIVMLLEMLGDMPEMIEDVKKWHPLSYTAHFEASTIADRGLAIEAYAVVPPVYKIPFEETIALIDELIATTVVRLDAEIAAANMEIVRELSVGQSRNIQRLMDSASAIMHGSTETLTQDDIDQIMEA